ncbi:MAG: VWA domain-containing protein [Candidatus Nanopelagicales bacterium]
MSFLSGWRLLFLLAPIALLAAYLLVQRRRHAQVVRFTSVDLLDSVAPQRSGWQRHLPAAGVLLSLVAMVIAFAQPVMAVPVPLDRATILLTLDTSASMASQDVAPNRLLAAEERARQFVEELPDGVQVGLVTFDTSARLLVAPTDDKAQVLGALGNLSVGPGTATADGISAALAAIQGVPKGDSGKPTPAAIVLMSDGTPTVAANDADPMAAAEAASAEAGKAGIPVDTIAFGTTEGTVTVQGRDVAVPVDTAAMEQIAQQSGGKSFAAETSDQLGSIYDALTHDIAYETKTQEVTALFVGIALALAVAAAIAALLWTQRIV